MKFLPPPIDVPSFFKFLGFKDIPAGPEDVKERYRQMAKKFHPDAGGNEEDFKKLQDAAEKAQQYFDMKEGKYYASIT